MALDQKDQEDTNYTLLEMLMFLMMHATEHQLTKADDASKVAVPANTFEIETVIECLDPAMIGPHVIAPGSFVVVLKADLSHGYKPVPRETPPGKETSDEVRKDELP